MYLRFVIDNILKNVLPSSVSTHALIHTRFVKFVKLRKTSKIILTNLLTIYRTREKSYTKFKHLEKELIIICFCFRRFLSDRISQMVKQTYSSIMNVHLSEIMWKPKKIIYFLFSWLPHS